jgi:hypothetical protein
MQLVEAEPDEYEPGLHAAYAELPLPLTKPPGGAAQQLDDPE